MSKAVEAFPMAGYIFYFDQDCNLVWIEVGTGPNCGEGIGVSPKTLEKLKLALDVFYNEEF